MSPHDFSLMVAVSLPASSWVEEAALTIRETVIRFRRKGFKVYPAIEQAASELGVSSWCVKALFYRKERRQLSRDEFLSIQARFAVHLDSNAALLEEESRMMRERAARLRQTGHLSDQGSKWPGYCCNGSANGAGGRR